MVSTRNTSKSNANPPRMQDPLGDADNRSPGTVEAMQAHTNEVEALRLVNQRLIEELEQLTRQMQHPRETRQTQEGHNIPPPRRTTQSRYSPRSRSRGRVQSSQRAWTTISPRGGRKRSRARRTCRERRTTSSPTWDGRAIMGAEVHESSTGARPCEGGG